jgi:hypothetical protein
MRNTTQTFTEAVHEDNQQPFTGGSKICPESGTGKFSNSTCSFEWRAPERVWPNKESTVRRALQS